MLECALEAVMGRKRCVVQKAAACAGTMIALCGSAEAIDLNGVWASGREVCDKIFVTKNNKTSFHRNADHYFEEVVGRIFEKYEEALRRSGAVDFDDLLGRTLELLESHPEVLHRYADRYLFLDGPAVKGSPDARMLADLADFVVLVVGAGRDTPAAVRKASSNFDPDKLAGTILNQLP